MESNMLILTPKDLDLLGTKIISRHVITAIDLSVARTSVKYELSGGFFGIMELTTGANLTVSFNDPNSVGITFDSEQQIRTIYNKVYITNTAQAGATVKFYCGFNDEYIPYYRTKAILPTVTTLVTGKVSVLSAAITAILPALALRRQFIIYNNDLAGAGNTIYIGTATVTLPAGANPGVPILAGTERQFVTQPFYTGAIYGIAENAPVQILYWYCNE